MDKALSQLGVDQSEIAQMNQSQKEKRYSENFYNYVSSFVGSMVKGVSVIKIAEGEVGSSDYEVAVAIKYSPEQQSEAANELAKQHAEAAIERMPQEEVEKAEKEREKDRRARVRAEKLAAQEEARRAKINKSIQQSLAPVPCS